MFKRILKHNKEKNPEKKEPLIMHLKELRRTIISLLFVIVIGSVICYGFFREPLMGIFTRPLEDMHIPIIYTNISEPFTTEIKVGIIAGIIVSSPIAFLLIWHFVAPAIFSKNKVRVLIYIFISVILFCLGVCFCYFIIFPFVLQFFLGIISIEIKGLLTISDYVNFLFKMIIPFGLTFETPLIVYFLSRFQIVKTATFKHARKYVLLSCFILGAIITPPDVISQLCVATPIYLMFEIGVLFGNIVEKHQLKNTLITTK